MFPLTQPTRQIGKISGFFQRWPEAGKFNKTKVALKVLEEAKNTDGKTEAQLRTAMNNLKILNTTFSKPFFGRISKELSKQLTDTADKIEGLVGSPRISLKRFELEEHVKADLPGYLQSRFQQELKRKNLKLTGLKEVDIRAYQRALEDVKSRVLDDGRRDSEQFSERLDDRRRAQDNEVRRQNAAMRRAALERQKVLESQQRNAAPNPVGPHERAAAPEVQQCEEEVVTGVLKPPVEPSVIKPVVEQKKINLQDQALRTGNMRRYFR